MGKLSIQIHGCQLYSPVSSGNCTVNPCVAIDVDGTYRFQTRVKKNTLRPQYSSSFFVGNTHRLAVIEVSVYDVQEPSGLVLPGIGVFTAKRGLVRAPDCTLGSDADGGGLGSRPLGNGVGVPLHGVTSASSGAPVPVLLGRCYIALERLVHNEYKQRTYYLASPPVTSVAVSGAVGGASSSKTVGALPGVGNSPSHQGAVVGDAGPSLLLQSLPQGITGTISISLKSDTLGEPSSVLRLDETLEAAYVSRLRRFLVCYDKPKLAMLDVIMAHVRDTTELIGHSTSRNDATGSANRSLASASGWPTLSSGTLSTSNSATVRRQNGATILKDDSVASSRKGTRTANGGGVAALSSSLLSPHGKQAASQSGSQARRSPTTPQPPGVATRRVSLGGRPELTVNIPERETFEEMMRRLCTEYNVSEPGDHRVVVRVEGCTNINKSEWNQSLVGSDDLFVVLRTAEEQLETGETALQTTAIWAEANTVALDVVHPDSFSMVVILMGRRASKVYEIGRCHLSVAPLSRGYTSRRNMLLCSTESVTQVAVHGVVHLLVRPINFGDTPKDMVEKIDDFYDRLNRFFRRYDPLRLPEVDLVARARWGEMESYMSNLVVEYGREPGSVRLLVAVNSLVSLRETADTDLTGQDVRVVITMGSSTAHTTAFTIRKFAPTKLGESFMFDVVRETDLLRIDVVNARKESIVYGRVDFSCMNTQRGVTNKRNLYLVGAAGTRKAYFSGIIRVSLQSDEIGHEYLVDMNLEKAFEGRLRRYVYRRIPESVHRVNLAIATVFDVETFMAHLAAEYGDEDPTFALYFTVDGCRDLRSGFGGINPYVVVRVGIDAYTTKVARATVEPDYFEFCQFFFDRLSDMEIVLVVMDQSDITGDEEIGRAVIPLMDVQPSRQYNEWLPVLSEKKNGKMREVGSIGFRYTVVDLDVVDRTRARLVKEQYARRRSYPSSMIEPRPVERTVSMDAIGGGGDGGGTLVDGAGSGTRTNAGSASSAWRRWGSDLRKYFQISSLSGVRSTRGMNTTGTADRESDHKGRRKEDGDGRMSVDEDASRAVPVRSGASRVLTMNLMDGGISTVEEFCSDDASLLNFAGPSDIEMDMATSFDRMLATQNNELDMMKDFYVHGTNGGGEVTVDSSRLQLRVRLLSCTSLFNPGRHTPNPYVLLSTLQQSCRSRVLFATTEPHFNQIFEFDVEDPRIDYLSVSVLTDTPYGTRRLGHCVLSMRNVQRGAMRTRWVSLVVRPFQNTAVESGSVYLSMGGINFGTDCLPSMDAENRLREQIREYLTSHARRQLHRLEWYVGEFSQLESVLLGSWFREKHGSGARNGTKVDSSVARSDGERGGDMAAGAAADLEVAVYGLSHLYFNGFLAEGFCTVKAKVDGRTKAKIKAVIGRRGSFIVPESVRTIHFSVEEPATTLVRLTVVLNDRVRIGECYFSLADLHRGVAKQRTLMLVTDARSSHAQACGLIHVSILSHKYGSCTPAPSEEELALYSRLTRLFYYYIPAELAMVDVRYAMTLNVAAYLNRMVETYGPEPCEYHVRFTVDRCRNLSIKQGGTSFHFYCIVRIGLQEFQSSIVEGRSECIFCESFNLVVGLPERENVELILMLYYTSKQMEVGRTHFELKSLRRAEENAKELALVSDAGTQSAGVSGLLRVSAFPADFGRSDERMSRNYSSIPYGIEGQPALMPTVSVMWDSAQPALTSSFDRERSAPVDRGSDGAGEGIGADRVPPSSGALHMVVRAPEAGNLGGKADTALNSGQSDTSASVAIVGFAGLTIRDEDVYFRVTERDTVLLKTKPIPVSELVALDPRDATFVIPNVAFKYDKVYTLKLGARKFLGAVTLCYADFCVTRCAPGTTVDKRLRLYDVNAQFIGICRLRIRMPDVLLSMPPLQYLTPGVFEPLMDDIASLVFTYMPKDLRRLDVILCQAPDIRRVHRALRRQLAPSVVATIYLAIHDVRLYSSTVRYSCAVMASVGSFTAEASRREPGSLPFYPYGMSKAETSKLEYPLLRLDITTTGSATALTLCVCNRISKTRTEEVGRTVVSLRALLTRAVFDMREKVQVPLVSIRHAANQVHATLIGTITFSVIPPAFEMYVAPVCFASGVVEGFDRSYVRYYVKRICSLLSSYDANSLVDIHLRLYETYVASSDWEKGLPTYLADLIERWGPELITLESPPLLKKKNDQHEAVLEKRETVADSTEATPGELMSANYSPHAL